MTKLNVVETQSVIVNLNTQKLGRVQQTILRAIVEDARAELKEVNKKRAKEGKKQKKSVISMIPAELLRIDYSYQRPADEKRVLKIAAEWNPDKANVLICSVRKDGVYICDGQHTALGGILAGETEFACKLMFDLTPEEEAEFFSTQQDNKKNISVMIKFRADLFRGVKYAVEIQKACEERFITLRFPGGTCNDGRNIEALTSLISTYKKYQIEGVEAGLDMFIAAGWDDYDYVYSHAFLSIIKVVCDTIAYKHEDYDGETYNSLIRIMSLRTPEQFLADAKKACAVQESKQNMHTDEKALKKYIKYLGGLVTLKSIKDTPKKGGK